MKNLTDFRGKRWKPVWIRACKDAPSKVGHGPQDFDSKGSLPTFCQISEIKKFSHVLHGLKIKTLTKMAGEFHHKAKLLRTRRLVPVICSYRTTLLVQIKQF